MHNENDKTEVLGDLTRITGRAVADPGQQLGPGTPVGRYVILEMIGRGGMGEVYAAFDPQLDRRIALKFLSGAQSEDAERLLEEARTLAQLSHPNVLPVYDVGTFGRSTFLATEFVRGGTLRDWINQERRDPAECLAIFSAAGEGLSAAHQAGVIHRDVKPGNILIGEDQRVRVADFGVAKRTDLASPGKPDSADSQKLESWASDGRVSGTPGYMSPEQIRGEDQDARTDQFSFGCALYESLTQTRPFRAPNLIDRLQAIESQKLTELDKLSGVSETTRRAILRMLKFDPADRFPSMADALAALRPRRRSRRWLVALSSAAIAASAAALVVFYQQQQQSAAQLCSGGAQRLIRVWDEPIRGDLSQRFADSPDALWHSVESSMDRYAAEWTQAYQGSCEATHRLGEQSTALLDQSMSCLDERLAALRAATELMAGDDESGRNNSLRVVSQLPSIAACTDREYLLAEGRLPDDLKRREEYTQLRDQIAAARVLSDGRRYDQSRELAEGIAAEAAAQQFADIESSARYIIGDGLERIGELPESRQQFEQAVDLGLAHGLPYQTTRAASGLVWALMRAGEFDLAEPWLQVARATVQNGPPDARLQSYVHSTAATLFQDQARYEESLDEARSAYQLLRDAFGDEHLQTAAALANYGNAMRFQGDFPAMIENTRRAIEVYETQLGFMHRDTLQLYSNLAGAMIETEQAEQALPIMLRVRSALTEMYGTENLETGFQNVNLGGALQGVGRHADAIAAYQLSVNAFEANLEPGHPYFAFAYNGIGTSQIALGDHQAAIATLQPALEIVTSQETHPQLIAEVSIALLRAQVATGLDNAQMRETLRLASEAMAKAEGSVDHLSEHFATLSAQLTP